MYRTRCVPGMLHLEGEARDWSTYNEYSFRIILMMLIPISQLNFEGVECRILFTSCANTPKTWWEGNLLFLRKASKFLETYFRKTLIAKNNNDNNNVPRQTSKARASFRACFLFGFLVLFCRFHHGFELVSSSLYTDMYIHKIIYFIYI